METIPDYVARLAIRLSKDAAGGGILRAVAAMAADLPPMPASLKTARTRFHGCQSQIWLVIEHDRRTGLVEVTADSDARIMRGLLAIAVGLYHHRSPSEIAEAPPSVLLDTGLMDLLAPSRANGFARLLASIHGFGVRLSMARGEVA